MTAIRDDIHRWLRPGHFSFPAEGATHVIIAHDTFDGDNYPVYVRPGQSVKEAIKRVQGASMQRVDEVYDLSLDLDGQLGERRAWHDDEVVVAEADRDY